MKKVLLFLFVCQSILMAAPLEQELAQAITYHTDGENKIGHIYIGDHKNSINQGTWLYVKKALDYYKEIKPAFIILELDTPGGEVFSAQKISDALKEMDIQHDIPVVAYINNWAISAGAMLAYSSRFIAIVKDASMGAAQPVTQKGEATSEKVNSAIRADFANRAAFFDRNPLIAEAMVDADLFLVWRDGKVVQLHDADEVEPEDQIITKKDKLLTLNAKQLMQFGVANITLSPQKIGGITEAEKLEGQWPASKELLFTYPFFAQIPNAEIVSYQMDWKTRFFAFLSNPIVTSLLFLGMMFCFYMELNTPGFGVAGGLGLVCLVFIILASFAMQLVGWLELIILIAGIALILVEVLVIPGFGVIGILGILMALGAIVALLLPGIKDVSFDFDTNTLNAAGAHILKRLIWLSATFVVGVILIAISSRYITRKLALFSPLVLKGEQDSKKGYVSGAKRGTLPLVGSEGVVISPLRPAGKVEIAGELYDAVSNGGFIEKSTAVVIASVEGSKIVVEEKTQ